MAALAIALQWHLLAISFLMILALFYVGKGLLDSDEQIKEENEDENIVLPKTHVPISLWVFAILGGTALIPELIGSDWAPFRMADDLEASPGLAGMGYVAFTTGMVIGRLSGDWILVKFGKDNHIKYSVVLALAGLSVACLIDLTPLIFIGLTVAGTGIAVLFPALYDAAAQDPHRPSAALGAMTAGSRSILLIVPVSIGFLADSSIFSVGMAMAVFAIPSLLIMVNLSKRNKVF